MSESTQQDNCAGYSNLTNKTNPAATFCRSALPQRGALRHRPDLVRLWSSWNTVDVDDASHDSVNRYWNCPLGKQHPPFQRTVIKIFQTQTCPICTLRTLAPGYNDLATTHPRLASQWSPVNTLSPHAVMSNNMQHVQWIGDCGHTWAAVIKTRAKRGTGCPFCAGTRVLAGFNDFATHFPHDVRNWYDPDRLPTTVSAYSNVTIQWRCDEGHVVWRSVRDWVKSGCWYCSGRRLLTGWNDLQTIAPQVAAQWSPSNQMTPDQVKYNHRGMAQWECDRCGHEWEAIVRSRVRGTGCPSCSVAISFLEEVVYAFVTKHYDGIIMRHQRPIRDGDSVMELDIWLPELNLALEVHDFTTHSRTSDTELSGYREHATTGSPYKKGPTYHERKRRLAREQLGVTVIDVWEDTVRMGDPALFQLLAKHLEYPDPVIANPKVAHMVATRRIAYEQLDHRVHSMSFAEFNCVHQRTMLTWRCVAGHQYTASLRQQTRNRQPCGTCRKKTAQGAAQ